MTLSLTRADRLRAQIITLRRMIYFRFRAFVVPPINDNRPNQTPQDDANGHAAARSFHPVHEDA